MAGLTPKQETFAQEYLVDLNATQAAIRAGYSAKTAAQVGHENLRKPEIAARVAALQAKRVERVEVTQDYVLRRLLDNVERAMQAEPVTDREGNETGEYTYQGAVANGALKLLGEHLGMFKKVVEHHDKTLEQALQELPPAGPDAEAAAAATGFAVPDDEGE
jgi:phage terminase small subunit